jgi:hypothetical protein
VKIPPPSLLPERAKVAEFYSARSETITPLPWQTFAPPLTDDLTDEEKCMGRIYFARSPGSEIWVHYYDLPA